MVAPDRDVPALEGHEPGFIDVYVPVREHIDRSACRREYSRAFALAAAQGGYSHVQGSGREHEQAAAARGGDLR